MKDQMRNIKRNNKVETHANIGDGFGFGLDGDKDTLTERLDGGGECLCGGARCECDGEELWRDDAESCVFAAEL